MANLMANTWHLKPLKKLADLILAGLLLSCTLAAPALGQTLLLRENFAIPAAVAAAQDVQGNLYLATSQGQVHQLDPSGKKLALFSPDEMLYPNSLQVLPGLQLMLFDRNSQQLYWLDRFMTVKGRHALNEGNQPGFVDAVAQAEGNGLWLVDGSQQRLIRQQLPGGEIQLSVPLNLVAKTGDKLAIRYLREHKGKLYLYSPSSGMLVFDNMGNYEQTLKMPAVQDLWLEGNRFYFIMKGYLGYLDLETKEVVQIPILDKDIRQILVKGSNIWLLGQEQAVRYVLMP